MANADALKNAKNQKIADASLSSPCTVPETIMSYCSIPILFAKYCRYIGTAAWYTVCSVLFGLIILFGIYLISACSGTMGHLSAAASYVGHLFTAAAYIGFGTIILQFWGHLSPLLGLFLGLFQGPLALALPAVAPAIEITATHLPLDKVIVTAFGALISAWSFCSHGGYGDQATGS